MVHVIEVWAMIKLWKTPVVIGTATDTLVSQSFHRFAFVRPFGPPLFAHQPTPCGLQSPRASDNEAVKERGYCFSLSSSRSALWLRTLADHPSRGDCPFVHIGL